MSTDAQDRKAARRRAERAGRRSEWAAAFILQLKGYRILARRFRAQSGEIDLIARRGGVVAFVEVKNRAVLEDAVSAVTARARRRIERAADMFAAHHRHLAECVFRYDIIAIAPWRFQHLRGAWRLGE